MYFTKQEFQVQAGRAADWEAFAKRLLDLMEKQDGLERASNLNSFGYPQKYTLAVAWDSRDHARAFGHNPELTRLLADARPVEFAQPSTPLEAFEVVHRVEADTTRAWVTSSTRR